MIPLKRMTPSKQSAAVASKIRNKILNTSSFFKVSLKTNNKALALALQAQREKSRQLEMEVVCLQKQVESLCFELAAKKYKEKKLLFLLKNLQSNTLQHMEMMGELLSDSGSQRNLEDDCRLTGNNLKHVATERITEMLPPKPDISNNYLCPNKNRSSTANSTERNTDKDVFHGLNRYKSDVEKKDSSALTALSHPVSSSLSEEVERLSLVFSQSNFDGKSALGSQKSQMSENLVLPPSVDNNLISGSSSNPKSQLTEPERTVLLNTTMDMTVSEAAEIVTVETKARNKKGHSCNLKDSRIQKKGGGSNLEVLKSSDLRTNEATAKSFFQTHQREEQPEEVLGPHILLKPRRNINASRIPRLGNSKNKYENKSKSCDSVLVTMEDYFADSEVILSKVSGKAADEDATVGPSSKVTLKKSRTKVRRQSVVFRKPLASLQSLSCHNNESGQSGQSLVNNEDGDIGHTQHLQEVHFCAEVVPHSESGPVDCMSPGGTEKTFVISVCGDSTSPILDQDLVPRAGSDCEREERLTVEGQCSKLDPQTETCSSWKRSQVETPEHSDNIVLADQYAVSGSGFQEHKKAKREEAGQSSKINEIVLEENFKPSKKQKKKIKSCNSPFGSGPEIDEPPICITPNPETSVDQTLRSIENQDISKYSHCFKRTKCNTDAKMCRKTLKQLTATETRNARETFEKIDSIPLKEFDACGNSVHRNVGDLLMNELPPWTLNIKAADSSSLSSTPGRMLVMEESVVTEAFPAGRALTMVTNTTMTSDSEIRERSMRRKCVLSYKEPPLNRKLRREDHSEATSHIFPVFKEKKKKQ